MDRTYLPILLLAGFVVVNAVGMIGLSHFTMRARPTPEKQTPYESGITPLGDARERFSVKFYMVAMLFIVFDIEIVFLYPWAVAFDQLAVYRRDRTRSPRASGEGPSVEAPSLERRASRSSVARERGAPVITCRDLRKSYGTVTAVRGV